MILLPVHDTGFSGLDGTRRRKRHELCVCVLGGGSPVLM